MSSAFSAFLSMGAPCVTLHVFNSTFFFLVQQFHCLSEKKIITSVQRKICDGYQSGVRCAFYVWSPTHITSIIKAYLHLHRTHLSSFMLVNVGQ